MFDYIYLLKNTATFPMAFRSVELKDLEEEDTHMFEDLVTHSPEPQEPIEPEALVQPGETNQFDTLHPEQDLSHIFKVFIYFFK